MFISEGVFHSQRGSVVTEIVNENQKSISVGYMIFAQGIGNLLGPVVGGMNISYFTVLHMV